MSIRTRWPWMTILPAAAPVLNPIGRDITGSALFSGEQLSIWRSIALIAIAILATMEWLERALRTLILKRRANGTPKCLDLSKVLGFIKCLHLPVLE
jgi:hypothetical protein